MWQTKGVEGCSAIPWPARTGCSTPSGGRGGADDGGAAQGDQRVRREGDGGDGGDAVQHRHRGDDGVRQRGDQVGDEAGEGASSRSRCCSGRTRRTSARSSGPSSAREGSNAYETWPEADESLLVEDTVTLAVQVNGKMRGKVELAVDASAGRRHGGGDGAGEHREVRPGSRRHQEDHLRAGEDPQRRRAPAEEVRRDVRRPACHGNADSYIPRAQRVDVPRRATRSSRGRRVHWPYFTTRAARHRTTRRREHSRSSSAVREHRTDRPPRGDSRACRTHEGVLARDGLSRPVVLDRRRGPIYALGGRCMRSGVSARSRVDDVVRPKTTSKVSLDALERTRVART